MNTSTFSVTEVVTAARCPRQFVLARGGTRVVPYGADAFGQASHVALNAIAIGARHDAALHAVLGRPMPDRTEVEAALFRIGLLNAHAHAKKVASTVDGGDLARFADTIRHIARLLTPALAKAAADAPDGKAAVAKVLLASEETVALELDGVTIRGRIDLMSRDLGETWLWDLKTYAGTDLAQLEQVRLYAMAYRAKGVNAQPALLHVVRDRIEIGRADPVRDGDAEKVSLLARHMRDWLRGTPPPSAPDLGTCRTCPAQTTCWRTWNRTLPDELDMMPTHRRGDTLPPTEAAPTPPAPAAVAPLAALTESNEPEPLWLGAQPRKGAVRVEPIEITRHVAIFGAAGSGKTYLAKTFVEEAILAGVPVLAFDVQGDILSLAQPLADDQIEPGLRARRDRYAAKAEVRMLTPMSDAGLRLSLNPLTFPGGSLSDEQSTVYSEVVAENLLAHVKIPASWRDHAAAYVAERVRSAMKKVRSLAIEDLVADIAQDGEVDDPLLDRTQRAKLVRDLRLLTRGSKNFLFQTGRPLSIDTLVTASDPASDPARTPLNVMYLNGLGDQKNKESFVAMVLADVYGWMLRQQGGRPRLLLYFDEIGPYMPPNGEPASKKLLKRIFKEGRKYGVCGLFCTQNFTDVDYKVVSQASTMAMGRINASQEKRKAADALGSPPNFDVQRAVDNLIGSPTGRFLMKRVDGPPHELQARRLLTVHGSPWGEEEVRAHTSTAARDAWAKG